MAAEYPIINGYQLTENWNTSGDCQWSYARKDGKDWFIKQYMAPKYKNLSDGCSLRQVENSRKKCEAFQKRQQQLFSQVRAANTGNIIPAKELFSFDSRFYSVSEKVNIASIPMGSIAAMQNREKLILLKVLTHSIASLHAHNVVHADLKPSNILVKKTEKAFTLKLIDFDASFLEANPKKGEEIRFDFCYVPPEQVIASNDDSVLLTSKIDIFALGVLFHEYWTGHRPAIGTKECQYLCAAVATQKPIHLDSSLPQWLCQMIMDMLDADPVKRPDAQSVFDALVSCSYSGYNPMHQGSNIGSGMAQNGKRRSGFYSAYTIKGK